MYDASILTSEKAAHPHALGRFSALPRPFLRWAGSKQALIPHIQKVLPESYGRYFEPFLGSGAVYFYLKPSKAFLSDASSDLINTWKQVKENSIPIIDHLKSLKTDKDTYYEVRDNRSNDPTIRAAEFIYLNKLCWNGLYRVNASGKFNVPYGANKSGTVMDEENIVSCGELLNRGAAIDNFDFSVSLKRAREGDLVYLDPPYVTAHNNNGFRDYNEKLFAWEDQVRLAKVSERLRTKGVSVVVSNANHRDIVNLYPNFRTIEFDRASTLASSSASRGRVSEVLMIGQR